MTKLPSRHRQYQESNLSRSFPVPHPFHNTQFRCHTLPTTPSSGATPFPQHPVPVPRLFHNTQFRCHTLPTAPSSGATPFPQHPVPVPHPSHNTQFRCHTLPTTPSSGATPFPQHPVPVPHPSHNTQFRCHTLPITPHSGARLLSLVPHPTAQPQCQPTTLPAGCWLWPCVQSWTLSTAVLYPAPPPPHLPEHADITSSFRVCVWWLDKHSNVS